MKKYDLIWGDSVAVRQAFIEQTHGIPIQFGLKELEEMDYTPFNGDAKLIEDTAEVIFAQTDHRYKHIFLTNGASGGCTIALRAMKKAYNCEWGVTMPGPYFPLYPKMVEAAGMSHTTTKEHVGYLDEACFMLDTPANPSGNHVAVPEWVLARKMPIIWDAVYCNSVYSMLRVPAPKHDIAVGSYSKLTGLNGIRLGWIATDNDYLASVVGDLIAPEYCGLSKPSKIIMGNLMDHFSTDPDYHWDSFERRARHRLDFNRNEWAKLERFFDGTPVSPNGMFYYAGMDEACKKLFTEAGVLWQAGSKCGTDDSYARFNIGQDNKVILAAVTSVIKTDKI